MLSLKNITKSYASWGEEVKVLKWINIEINEGEFVAIMWPSWSGKSTLMNIIWLLDTPTSWTYILDWTPVECLTWDEQSRFRWQKVWFIFQSYNLIPKLTALDQVMLPLAYQWVGKKDKENRAIEALTKLWLEHRLDHKPNQLSWWQQQRVAIARAIVSEPSIIMADEPTWALDSKTGEDVMQALNELHSEWKTILIITHDPIVSSYAKRVIHIKDGLVV